MQNVRTIKIVIVEDEVYYNRLLTKYVQTICNSHTYPDFRFEIKSYSNADECIEALDDETDIMILDYYLTNEDSSETLNGGDIFDEVQRHCPGCKVILISAMKNAHIATDLMRRGIYEYIDKNVNSRDRVGSVLQRVLTEEFQPTHN